MTYEEQESLRKRLRRGCCRVDPPHVRERIALLIIGEINRERRRASAGRRAKKGERR